LLVVFAVNISAEAFEFNLFSEYCEVSVAFGGFGEVVGEEELSIASEEAKKSCVVVLPRVEDVTYCRWQLRGR
jgi:hypothetical protein